MPLSDEWSSPSNALKTIKSRLSNNVGGGLSRLSLIDGIRLVVILGAYMLLRPYLIKLGGKFQERDHARANIDNESSSPSAMDPNSLRGLVSVPEDSDSDEDAPVEAKGWGQGARKRQRQFLRRMIEEEEKRLANEGSDEEIKEFLVD